MVDLQQTRRSVLAATGSVLLSGCSVLGSDGSGDDTRHSDADRIREVVVTSHREEPVRLAVRIETENGDGFSGVYTLSPDEYDESESVEGVPTAVTAFTADGTSRTWEHVPSTTQHCDAPDVEIVVEPTAFSLHHPC